MMFDNLKIKSQGFILVMIMSFLFICTLLAIGTAETSVILTKQVNAQWRFWQVSVAATNTNRKWAHQLEQPLPISCLSAYTVDNRYWERDAKDWQHAVCHDSKTHINSQTIIETIPQTLCRQDVDKLSLITLFRLTTQTTLPPNIHIKVQSVVAIPDHQSPAPKTCINPLSQISLGIQSWHME